MKKILLILVIGVMILLSGCTDNSGKENAYSLSSFKGGNDAVTIEFAEQSPPDKIRDQSLQPFSVRLLVENNGEYHIPENSTYVTLTGFNPDDLNLTDTSRTLNALRGYKKQGSNLIPGGKQQVVFDQLKYVNSVVSGSYPFKFYANICYPYETKAFAILCINGDTVPAINQNTQICDLEGEKQYANSAAPVQIENVQQYPYGKNSIQIQFDIVHKPMGSESDVYQKETIDSDCRINGVSPSSSDASFKKDRVEYIVESSIPGLNCESTDTNTNIVTLTDDKYTVTCIQDTTGQSEHEKPFTIYLKYDYLDRISKTIMVDHIDTQ
ncbi:MAG: hypothetical protein ACOC3V_03925 [bacterium]